MICHFLELSNNEREILNPQWLISKKGGLSCHEETEQDLAGKDQAQAEERGWEEGAEVGAGWVATDPVQGRQETAYAPIVVQRYLTKRVNPATM